MALNIRPLSPRLQEVACRELNEDPNRREQDLAHIKEWLKKQPHLKTARQDDQWLLSFLRGCKFSLERTKEKLDMYYTMRTMLPEFFSNRDPMLPELQEVLKLGSNLPLPELDDQGRRIIVARYGIADFREIRLENVIKMNLMFTDIILMEDDDVVICGDVSVTDFKGTTLALMAQITPTLVKKTITMGQEAYPFRPQGMHFINVNSTFTTIFNLVQSMLKEKHRKRVHVHGDDLESLYKIMPQKYLPMEYGGEGGGLSDIAADWKKKVESYREWFLEDEHNKSDEKKRPGKPKTHDSLFGLEGSFRQLSVDQIGVFNEAH